MFRAIDFRQNAEECIQSARVSKRGKIRKRFIDMARMWTLAAIELEEGRNKMPLLGEPLFPPRTKH